MVEDLSAVLCYANRGLEKHIDWGMIVLSLRVVIQYIKESSWGYENGVCEKKCRGRASTSENAK